MRIGAFDATHDLTYRSTGKEPACSAALLNADNAYARCATHSVVESWVIARERVRSTQCHEDTVAAGRNIHQVRRWVMAHRTDQTELVHNQVAACINDGDVVAEALAHPHVALVLGP